MRMAVTEVDTLATRVQEQCVAPVEQEAIVEFIRPILRDFDVAHDELVAQTVEHFEAEYIDEGGVIVEWNGERTSVDTEN